jgi:genome maintenance exonuclease 1
VICRNRLSYSPLTREIQCESRLALNAICNFNLPRVETDRGRFYATEAGHFPSVTSVLGLTSNSDWLDSWVNRVGKEEADKIGLQASLRGTNFHTLCASYLMGEKFDPCVGAAWFSFLATWKYLEEISEVQMLESAVFSKRLKYAGTLDCLAKFRGKTTLIDFKSYGRQKSIEDLDSAFIQCALYSLSDQVEGVEQLCVIYGSEKSSGCEVIPFSEGIKMKARARVRQYWEMQK